MLSSFDEPLDAAVIDGDALTENAGLFLSTEFTANLHVFALYADVEFYRRQFRGLDELTLQRGALLSLVGLPGVEDGRRTIPLALLPRDVTPSDLQSLVTSMPVLTITTLSLQQTLLGNEDLRNLARCFVVIDQPLGPQLQRWTETGWTTRFVVARPTADRPWWRITLAVDELPHCVFLAFDNDDGVGEFEEFVDRERLGASSELEIDDELRSEVDAVSAQLAKAWWTIPQAT